MLKGLRSKMNSKGFTLIELIVVIAIIGILMTLAVPRLIGYQEAAKETADNQLMALYGNTFNVLLAQGKIRNSSGASFTIGVENNGDMTLTGTGSLEVMNASGSYNTLKLGTDKGNPDENDGETPSAPTLYALQAQYIATSGKGGGGADNIPAFSSKIVTERNGANVVITTGNTASVEIKPAPSGS